MYLLLVLSIVQAVKQPTNREYSLTRATHTNKYTFGHTDIHRQQKRGVRGVVSFFICIHVFRVLVCVYTFIWMSECFYSLIWLSYTFFFFFLFFDSCFLFGVCALHKRFTAPCTRETIGQSANK